MKCEKGLQIVIPTVLCLLLVLPASAALGVNGITPSSGLNTGTVFITNLSGTDFPDQDIVPDEDVVLVSLNMSDEESIIAQYVTVASPTKITCLFDITGAEAGQWNVTVINKTSNASAVLENGFTVENHPPDVVSITPDHGVNNAPVQITNLTGYYFLEGVTVNLTKEGEVAIPGLNVTWGNSSQITCEFNITSAPTGAWNVNVTNPDGKSDVLLNGFTISYPTPVIDSITPSSGTNTGVIGITNLAGSGFMPGANVTLRMDGQADIQTINGPIVEPGKILCFFDLSSVHVGAWDVVVTNPDLQNATLAGGFTVRYPDSPAVTGIDPPEGVNTGSVTANITGSGFHDNAIVVLSLGAQNITGTGGVVSPGSITGVTFNLTGMPADDWNLTVTNEDGQSATRADAFTITNPPPTVTSVDPSSGVNAEGWLTIDNITGTGFLPGAHVTFSKEMISFDAASVNVSSSTRLSCQVNLAGEVAGVYAVTVTNTDDLSGTLAGAFTVLNPAPVIHSITPSAGENTGSVDIIALTGENFLDGAGVNLTKSGESAIPGNPVAWTNSTTLTCTFNLTDATAGAWDVEVVNPDGRSDTYEGLFTVTNPPPSPLAITPDKAPNNWPIVVAITGNGFLPDSVPRLVKGSSVIDPDSYTVNVTTQTIMSQFDLAGVQVGLWDVSVTNTGDNLTGTLPEKFNITYPAAPDVTGIDPVFGVNDGPFTIANISGTGFHPGATVNLSKSGEDDIAGTNVTVLSEFEISVDFNLAGKETGLWDVVVTNNDGQSDTYAAGFEIRYPAPVINSIDPAKGDNDKIVSLTSLSGSGFRSGASVRLNSTLGADIVAGNVNVTPPGLITCTLNLTGQPVGAWDVIVTNSDGQSGIKEDGFTIEYPAPTVTSIDPPKASNDGVVLINAIKGTNFRTGATVWLVKSMQPDIQASDVHVIDSQTLNCSFDLEDAETGYWTVGVINPDGKYGTLPYGFKVLPPAAVPNFTAAPTYGTVPLTVQFTDTSLNNPDQYGWNFGDGTVLVGLAGTEAQNPLHTYNEVGTYNVTLTVINEGNAPDGDFIRKDYYIVVVRTPVANFTADRTTGNAPLLVQFTDTSDGEPISWLWNFGDGSISREQNPYHLYTKPGVYTVSLAVSNRAGRDSITKTDLITVKALVEADFTANRTSGISPMSVQFTDLSTGSPDSWSWAFGDGTTSIEQDPQHTYETPGVYNVRLTVSNSGNGATDTKTVNEYIVVREGMMASFTYTTSNPENLAPLTVAFTDTSHGTYDRVVWNFGDKFISTEQNPIHTYTAPGNYTVILTISGSGDTSSASQVIEVKQAEIPDFTVSPATGSAPLTVMIADASTGNTVSRNYWILNEDLTVYRYITDAELEQYYTIETPGNYTVQMEATFASGNVLEKIRENCIQVLPFP